MTKLEAAQEDANVPAMAVKALTAAQRRALASGREVLYVKNGELVRNTPNGPVRVKTLRRVKVAAGKKRIPA
jgi:hypothetical protein